MNPLQMMKKKFTNKFFSFSFTPSLTLAIPFIVTLTQGAQSVQFGCDAPPGYTCYFSITYDKGLSLKNFILDGGQRTIISGLTPGVDFYTVAINQPPPSYSDQCGKRFPCKYSLVNFDYNN